MVRSLTDFTHKIALLALGALVCIGSASSRAEDEAAPNFFPQDSSIAEPAYDKNDIVENRRRLGRVIDKKIRVAQLLYQMKRYSDCAELCEEILIMDKSCSEADKLRRDALKASTNDAARNTESEMDFSSNRQLVRTLKESLAPPSGPVEQRPHLNPDTVPFQEKKDEFETVKRDILSKKILELNLSDAELNQVLQLLFKTTGINIIYRPEDVAGKTVTVHGRDMTLGSVLEFLGKANDIGYTVEDGTVWIYGKEGSDTEGGSDRVRSHMSPVVIPFRYGLTQVFDEEAQSAGASGGGGGDGEGGLTNANLKPGKSDIEAMLKWMEENWPGWPKETRWYIDQKLNRLIIASTPEIIEEVKKIVEMLDVPPIQVLITAQFVEISENDYDEIGVDLGFTERQDNMAVQITAASDTTSIMPAAPTPSASFGLTAMIDHYKLTATLKALKQNQKGRVVNAPRVIALNNQPAQISIVTKEWYANNIESVTNSTSTDLSTTSATSFMPTDWQTEKVGWMLDVLPSVGSDLKNINMRIVPKVTTKAGEQPREVAVVQQGTDDDGKVVSTVEKVNLPIPLYKTQTLDVNVGVEDGKTVVIGGLYTTDDSKNVRGTPFLMDVPGLGFFFRSKADSKTRNALLIFVTAKIIRSDNGTYTDAPQQFPPLKERKDGNLDITPDRLNQWLGDPTMGSIDASPPVASRK